MLIGKSSPFVQASGVQQSPQAINQKSFQLLHPATPKCKQKIEKSRANSVIKNTPININRLSYWLNNYKGKKYIVDGFKFGFDVGYKGTLSPQKVENSASAKENSEIVSQKIMKEIEANRFVGPFDIQPFPIMQISPLGLVKKKTPGSYRMIHHLSFPEGSSINDGIPDEDCHVQYASIEQAVEKVKLLKKNCFCAKTDISSAFRIINIKEYQYHLFGFMWEGKYYYYKNLQMVCSYLVVLLNGLRLINFLFQTLFIFWMIL